MARLDLHGRRHSRAVLVVVLQFIHKARFRGGNRIGLLVAILLRFALHLIGCVFVGIVAGFDAEGLANSVLVRAG